MAGLSRYQFDLTKDDFFGSKAAFVIIITVLLTPLILKKQLEELKIISVTLFVCIFSFIILSIIQLGIEGIRFNNPNFPPSKDINIFLSDYFVPKFDYRTISSMSPILVSFSC